MVDNSAPKGSKENPFTIEEYRKFRAERERPKKTKALLERERIKRVGGMQKAPAIRSTIILDDSGKQVGSIVERGGSSKFQAGITPRKSTEAEITIKGQKVDPIRGIPEYVKQEVDTFKQTFTRPLPQKVRKKLIQNIKKTEEKKEPSYISDIRKAVTSKNDKPSIRKAVTSKNEKAVTSKNDKPSIKEGLVNFPEYKKTAKEKFSDGLTTVIINNENDLRKLKRTVNSYVDKAKNSKYLKGSGKSLYQQKTINALKDLGKSGAKTAIDVGAFFATAIPEVTIKSVDTALAGVNFLTLTDKEKEQVKDEFIKQQKEGANEAYKAVIEEAKNTGTDAYKAIIKGDPDAVARTVLRYVMVKGIQAGAKAKIDSAKLNGKLADLGSKPTLTQIKELAKVIAKPNIAQIKKDIKKSGKTKNNNLLLDTLKDSAKAKKKADAIEYKNNKEIIKKYGNLELIDKNQAKNMEIQAKKYRDGKLSIEEIKDFKKQFKDAQKTYFKRLEEINKQKNKPSEESKEFARRFKEQAEKEAIEKLEKAKKETDRLNKEKQATEKINKEEGKRIAKLRKIAENDNKLINGLENRIKDVDSIIKKLEKLDKIDKRKGIMNKELIEELRDAKVYKATLISKLNKFRTNMKQGKSPSIEEAKRFLERAKERSKRLEEERKKLKEEIKKKQSQKTSQGQILELEKPKVKGETEKPIKEPKTSKKDGPDPPEGEIKQRFGEPKEGAKSILKEETKLTSSEKPSTKGGIKFISKSKEKTTTKTGQKLQQKLIDEIEQKQDGKVTQEQKTEIEEITKQPIKTKITPKSFITTSTINKLITELRKDYQTIPDETITEQTIKTVTGAKKLKRPRGIPAGAWKLFLKSLSKKLESRKSKKPLKLQYTPTLKGIGVKTTKTGGKFSGFEIRGNIIKPVKVKKYKRKNLKKKSFVKRHRRRKPRR